MYNNQQKLILSQNNFNDKQMFSNFHTHLEKMKETSSFCIKDIILNTQNLALRQAYSLKFNSSL